MKGKEAHFFKGKRIDMTQGEPLVQILRFSVPMLLGNVLQQLYNTVDSMVVGNFVGSGALAAVGASGPIINLMVSFFLGLSVGAGVIISQSFGAREMEKLQKTVSTEVTAILMVGLCITAVGIAASPLLLHLMNVPAEIFSESLTYMRITFGGIIFLMMFNVLNGIMQGIGDSVSPFIFLVISCGINIVLDVVFVVVFSWGVAGVAWATLIAQACSVLFGFYRINRPGSEIHILPGDLSIERYTLKEILRLGIPTGFQNSLSSIGNLIVLALLNSFGPVIIAANTAVIKIDSFCTMPMMTFGSAVTVFVGQNIGAGKRDRIRKGTRITLLVSGMISAVISSLLFFFGEYPLRLFTQEEAVIAAGMDKFHIVAPFYIMMGFFGIFSGVIRGCGHTFVPMLVSILSVFVGRIPVAYLLANGLRMGALGVHWSMSLCWTLEALFIFVYYCFGKWRKDLQDPVPSPAG